MFSHVTEGQFCRHMYHRKLKRLNGYSIISRYMMHVHAFQNVTLLKAV